MKLPGKSIPPARLYALQSANGTITGAGTQEPPNGPRLTVPETGRYRVQWGVTAGAGSGSVGAGLYRGPAGSPALVHMKGLLSNSLAYVIYNAELSLAAGELLRIYGSNSAGESTIFAERSITLTYLGR